MVFQYISVLCYLAVPVFWDRFGLFVIVAAGAVIAVLLRKGLKKSAAEDPPVRLFRPRFNQRSGTSDTELRPNPVRRYASCHCLDAQYEREEVEDEGGGEHGLRPEWQELLFHTEVQETDSHAWKPLEAYIAKVRDEGSDELNPMVGIGSEKWEQIVTLPKSIGTLKSVKVFEPVWEPPGANPSRDRRHDEFRRVRSVYFALSALVSIRDHEVRAPDSKSCQYAVSLRQLQVQTSVSEIAADFDRACTGDLQCVRRTVLSRENTSGVDFTESCD